VVESTYNWYWLVDGFMDADDQVLSVQNILARNSDMRFSVKPIHKLNAQDLERLLPEAAQVLTVTSSLAILTCLKHQIATLEKAVRTRLKQTPAYAQLLKRQWHRRDFGPGDRARNR
jgi:hypothetical protein